MLNFTLNNKSFCHSTFFYSNFFHLNLFIMLYSNYSTYLSFNRFSFFLFDLFAILLFYNSAYLSFDVLLLGPFVIWIFVLRSFCHSTFLFFALLNQLRPFGYSLFQSHSFYLFCTLLLIIRRLYHSIKAFVIRSFCYSNFCHLNFWSQPSPNTTYFTSAIF